MSKLSEKLKEEFRALLPPAVFFFIALHLVAFVRSLMLRGTGIAAATSLTVTLGALIIAKAVLLGDMLPFINHYPHDPLIYNIGWKTAIYSLVATLVHYLENLFEFWHKTGGFGAANELMLSEIEWPHFWAIEILLVVMVLTYCIMAELVRVFGKDKVKETFFG
jgi:hypothetical protein